MWWVGAALHPVRIYEGDGQHPFAQVYTRGTDPSLTHFEVYQLSSILD